MTLGRTISQAEINNAAAGIVASLFATLDNVVKMKAVLDGYDVTALQGLGFTSTEANVLKSAFTDMANVATIWQGGAAAGTMPRDHRAFAKQLLGTGLY